MAKRDDEEAKLVRPKKELWACIEREFTVATVIAKARAMAKLSNCMAQGFERLNDFIEAFNSLVDEAQLVGFTIDHAKQLELLTNALYDDPRTSNLVIGGHLDIFALRKELAAVAESEARRKPAVVSAIASQQLFYAARRTGSGAPAVSPAEIPATCSGIAATHTASGARRPATRTRPESAK